MLKFFRHIRQKLVQEGHLSKYLIYALGEIILVVVGIIIALQINIWNEQRKDYNQIEKNAKSLAEDIRDDIEMIKVIKYTAEQINLRIDSLTVYVQNKRIEEISNLNLLNYTWIQVYRPYSWNRVTLEELKSSGNLSLIENKELLKMISDYDAFTRHMDEDYYTDKDQGENALQLLMEVINNNYPNLEELSEVFRVATVSGKISDVLNDPEYKKAKTYKMKLITNDINKVRQAINSYVRLRFNLNIRTQIELPELLEDAQNLIELLEEEYKFETQT